VLTCYKCGRIWKESVVAYSKAVSQNSPGRIKESQKTSEKPVFISEIRTQYLRILIK
jgi:hypothetical protein